MPKDDDQNNTSDFNKLILSELQSIGEKQEHTTQCVQDLTTDFKLQQQQSNMRWDAIEKLDQEQNKLLAEHSARSTAIQKDNELREIGLRRDMSKTDKRVQTLEMPGKLLKVVKSGALWIAAIGGAVIVISKVIGLW